ncbi:uncharacterized protein FTOL_10571 [Fusarium torulosum]|uniref:Uncharacterized protein n=1 Tax=Fusarium torulosum TaxID=33205 RepID=A0AAE8SM54_9HYPO|nr:uncharacterized protein FTOL_10571 [Fusarium torulosum]
MTDVFHPDIFEQKVRRLADGYRKRFGGLLEYDIEAELARFEEYRKTLKKYVVDGVAFMKSAQESNTKIVIEGANHRARGLTVLFPNTTRVGSGAFKTEDTEEIGTKLQEIGREWERRLAADADVDGSVDTTSNLE